MYKLLYIVFLLFYSCSSLDKLIYPKEPYIRSEIEKNEQFQKNIPNTITFKDTKFAIKDSLIIWFKEANSCKNPSHEINERYSMRPDQGYIRGLRNAYEDIVNRKYRVMNYCKYPIILNGIKIDCSGIEPFQNKLRNKYGITLTVIDFETAVYFPTKAYVGGYNRFTRSVFNKYYKKDILRDTVKNLNNNN